MGFDGYYEPSVCLHTQRTLERLQVVNVATALIQYITAKSVTVTSETVKSLTDLCSSFSLHEAELVLGVGQCSKSSADCSCSSCACLGCSSLASVQLSF
jgi:hypothetical protein